MRIQGIDSEAALLYLDSSVKAIRLWAEAAMYSPEEMDDYSPALWFITEVMDALIADIAASGEDSASKAIPA